MFNSLRGLLGNFNGRLPSTSPLGFPSDPLPIPAPPAPPSHWWVAMPGRVRPFILAEKETFDDAVTALETIALSFEDAGWHLDWQTEHVCAISKRCPEGELTGVLSVLPGGVRQQAWPIRSTIEGRT